MKAKGFTLLELLVAMAIFATAGMAIMQASSAHIRSLSQLDDLTIASYIAANQMQLAMLDNEWPGKENTQGELEMANRSWLWQQQLIKVPDNDLRLVQIRVSLAEAPEQVLYQLQSYKVKPGAKSDSRFYLYRDAIGGGHFCPGWAGVGRSAEQCDAKR